MTRTAVKMTGLTALAILGGALGLNCSSGKGGSTAGHVALALSVPPGLQINAVSYVIHEGTPVAPDSAIADVTGTINTSDPNATASVDHSFPRSTGDVVTLSADTVGAAPVHCTGTSTPFTVTAGQPIAVTVTVVCPNGAAVAANQNNGSVIVNGNFTQTGDHCPLLTSWMASPLQTSAPGGTINVAGSATDVDGDTLVYTWSTAPNGSFSGLPATPPGSNTYSCGNVASGVSEPDTLTLTVDDQHGCTASITIPVTCVGSTVVTGTAGASGTAGAGTAGAGTAGAGTAGAGTAGAGTAGAGTAGAEGGTAGAGTAGAGTAGAGTAGVMGTAGMGTAGAGVDPTACEQDGTNAGTCFSTTAPGTTAFGCTGFPGTANDATTQMGACFALVNCLRGQACIAQIAAANANDPSDYPFNDDGTPCLCGAGPTAANPNGATKAQCFGSTTWVGVCQAQYAAAAGGASNVSPNFFQTTLPIGIANNLFSCDVDDACIPASGI